MSSNNHRKPSPRAPQQPALASTSHARSQSYTPATMHHHDHLDPPQRASTSESVMNPSTSTTSSHFTILKVTSVLTTLASQLPGKRVARAAKKLYGYPRNSLSDPELANSTPSSGGKRHRRDRSGTRTCPGTPPPGYEESMESEDDTLEVEIATVGTRITNDEISRKFANQGHHLLTLSLSELENQNSPDRNLSFTRQLYIHSLAYLLRALPETLTSDEVSSITSALPASVTESIPVQHHCCHHHVVELTQTATPHHPTLHKLAMVGTSTTVSLLRSLTPYMRLLIIQIWLFCQRHRVAERSVGLVKSAGDAGIWIGCGVIDWLDLQSLLYEDHEQIAVPNQGDTVSNSTKTPRRTIVRDSAEAGGRVLKNVGSWVGGIVSSGVGGVVEGFSVGLEK